MNINIRKRLFFSFCFLIVIATIILRMIFLEVVHLRADVTASFIKITTDAYKLEQTQKEMWKLHVFLFRYDDDPSNRASIKTQSKDSLNLMSAIMKQFFKDLNDEDNSEKKIYIETWDESFTKYQTIYLQYFTMIDSGKKRKVVQDFIDRQHDPALEKMANIISRLSELESHDATAAINRTNRVAEQTLRMIFLLSLVGLTSCLLIGVFVTTRVGKYINIIRANEQLLLSSAKMSSLGEMASGVAHEINNPLTVIVARARKLISNIDSGSIDPEKFRENLIKIDQTAGRIVGIIKGMRAFSRNADNDPMVTVKVKAIIEECLELCQIKFQNHSIELKLEIENDAVISCRPTQIAQVVMNLLNNSFDAIEGLSEKWIEIKVIPLNGKVAIQVTDAGRGIPAKIAEKLMEPFFTTKEPGKGVGLGLSISKGIIEQHQGKFYYDLSSKNTRFVIELPRVIG